LHHQRLLWLLILCCLALAAGVALDRAGAGTLAGGLAVAVAGVAGVAVTVGGG
jgi:hypothetical protein